MADEERVTDTSLERDGESQRARAVGGGRVVADGRWDYEWGRRGGGGECGVQTRIFGIRLWLGTQGLCVILKLGWEGRCLTSYYTRIQSVQYDPIVIPRAGLKSAARQTKCRRRAVSLEEVGSGGTEEGFRGSEEERGAPGRIAAARATPAGSATPAGPRALRSRPRLVRPSPRPPAPLRRMRSPGGRPGGTRAARQRLPSVSSPPLVPRAGQRGRHACLARKSCARRSCGRSPGVQSAAAAAVHPRRPGQDEGSFRQGSLR
ncbi:hypothetical protein AB1E18_002062 [Capra hircus]